MFVSRSCSSIRFRTITDAGFVVTTLVLSATTAFGIELDFENFAVKQTWTVDDLGIEVPEGLFFNREGDTLYVASGWNDPLGSALYSLDVIRDPATKEITALANRQFIFSGDPSIGGDGRGLTAGWAFGPEGTLFYSYALEQRLGQRPGGIFGNEETFPLAPTGLPFPATAGLVFSPHITDANTGFDMMQLSDWSLFEHRISNVPLLPVGNGYFEPQVAQVLAEFPGVKGWDGTRPSVAGDIAYIPTGPHEGDLLVADFNGGDINILVIDKETGWAVDRTTNQPTLGTTDPELIRFAGVIKPWEHGNGPWALDFDPLTYDLFVTMATMNGEGPPNTVIQIGGFPPPDETLAAASLQPGDADQDLDFDQYDLVRVQIAAKYLTEQTSTWGEGDWDGAPGGEPGMPPTGDGQFDQLDIIVALGRGHYLTGPYAAVTAHPGGDGNATLYYDPGTGELAVEVGATELTSINIDSAASIFTGGPADNLGGSFDNDADDNIFKATFGSSFGSLTFGNVVQSGLSQEFVLNDLTVIGSLAGGGDLGAVDLIYVPEPSTAVLSFLAALSVVVYCLRKRQFPAESR